MFISLLRSRTTSLRFQLIPHAGSTRVSMINLVDLAGSEKALISMTSSNPVGALTLKELELAAEQASWLSTKHLTMDILYVSGR